jgi:hypothetical protein
MSLTLDGYPYLVIKTAENLGLGKSNAEIIRQALVLYGEKHGFDVEEEAFALVAKDILARDKFKKAKSINELLP